MHCVLERSDCALAFISCARVHLSVVSFLSLCSVPLTCVICTALSVAHRALSCFETGDMAPAREFLDQQDSRRDPEVFPMWDPQQLLTASRTLLLRSVVPQSVGEGSGSDETLSAADDSEYGSRYNVGCDIQD